MTRLYTDLPLEAGRELRLGRDPARYLGRVLRLRSGARITVFDGAGNAFEASISALGRDDVRLTLGQRVEGSVESPVHVRLVQGVSRGDRMDFLVQKATELGVGCIRPVLTECSVVRLDAARAEKRRRHWQKVAIAACEQCGRNRLPSILEPIDLEDHLSAAATAGTRILLSPTASQRLRDLPPPADGGIELLVGPEGGLTAEERQAAVNAGYLCASMGPRILRSETAGIAALALLQGLWGDM